MFTNYHTHTTRCQHAYGSDRAYIEAAIAAGITTLGFSDHVPYPYPDGFISGVRMHTDEVGEYIETMQRFKKEYADDLTLLIGFEAEYIASLWDDLNELLAPYDFDYFILGQHFLYTETSGLYSGTPTDREDYLAEYVSEVITALKTDRFTYLAHPDLFHYTGSDEIYRSYMVHICELAKELDIPLEINLNGIWDHRHYPSNRFFAIAKEVGNTFILGRDAHTPEAFADMDTLQKAEDFIKKLGISVIDTPRLRNPKA